jgi:phosphotransferase system IIB component
MDEDNSKQNDVVIEATEEETVEVVSGTDADVLLSLEEMIKNNIESIDKLRNELKQLREMFDDSFANNPTYREQSEKVKEVNKVKSQTRQQIMNQPAVLQLSNKIKSSRSEIKERQGALSDYLKEYQRMTGATEIEGRDGKIREIINDAKLIVRSDKSK